MEFMYLGTGASEGYPALFCQCERCSMAMELGGKNIRARTGALINSDLLLDFSPDMYMNKLRYKLDLGKVNHLIVTHSHTDHFAAAELMMSMSIGIVSCRRVEKNYIFTEMKR